MFVAAVSWSASAGDKPVVINYTSGTLTDTDRQAIEYFGKSYTVVNIDTTDPKHSYRLPGPISGFGPMTPVFIDQRCVSGTVTVAYVITVEGVVRSLGVLKSTDPSLDDIAKQRMETRLFRPAELDGKAVASIAASSLVFPCQP